MRRLRETKAMSESNLVDRILDSGFTSNSKPHSKADCDVFNGTSV